MSNAKETTSPTNEAESAQALARRVTAAIGKIVEAVGDLPPNVQLRALSGAATVLGLDKEQRSRVASPPRNNVQPQNRGNNNR
jgi:hypothetical protein